MPADQNSGRAHTDDHYGQEDQGECRRNAQSGTLRRRRGGQAQRLAASDTKFRSLLNRRAAFRTKFHPTFVPRFVSAYISCARHWIMAPLGIIAPGRAMAAGPRLFYSCEANFSD